MGHRAPEGWATKGLGRVLDSQEQHCLVGFSASHSLPPVFFILLWSSQTLAAHIPGIHFRPRLESLSPLCI